MNSPKRCFTRPDRRRAPIGAAVLWGFLLVAPASSAFAADVPWTPVPEWVEEVDREPEEGLPPEDVQDGVWHLLEERQVNVEQQAVFSRYRVRVLTEEGVRDSSRINLDFNPAFQVLTLHELRVHRDGEVFDKAASQQVQLLRREFEMERHVYDGSVSANLVVEDIRQGDVLEYAFTIEGANPILGNRFVGSFSTEYSVPVAHVHLRVFWPAEQRLEIREINTGRMDKRTSSGSYEERRWEARDVPARITDNDVPAWYSPHGIVHVSGFNSWQEVADWGRVLFELPSELPAELAAWTDELAGAPPEEQIAGALRAVQKRVRYVAMAMGPHSYQPYSLDTILQRRFGDCKDKALVLCAVLDRLGISASPAFVNTWRRGTIAEMPPSPAAFDHAVVKVSHAGRTYWLDPTYSAQSGPLHEIFFPDYGKALVLEENTRALTSVTPGGMFAATSEVRETFTLEDYSGNARLDVRTVYRGVDADTQRSLFRNANRSEVEKNYRDFYAERYGEIEINEALRFSDYEAENRFVTRESYLVRDLWKGEEGSDLYFQATFYPDFLESYLYKPSRRSRTTPFALGYPNNIRHVIRIIFPDDSRFEPEDFEVFNPYFGFNYECRQTDNLLSLSYHYWARRDHVSPDGVSRYLEDIESVQAHLGYSITVPGTVVLQGQGEWGWTEDVNWMALAFLSLLGFVTAGGAWKIYRWTPAGPPPPPLPASHGVPAPAGLGGWLLLPLLGLVLTVGWEVYNLFLVEGSLRLSTWTQLTSPASLDYHPAWQPVLLGSAGLSVVNLIFAGLLLGLFFSKKRQFPVLMCVFLVFSIVYSGLEALFSLPFSETDPEWKDEAVGQLVRSMIGAAVWLPYFRVSKRVKATFRA